MDGNGRWAQNKFLPRIIGHTNGVKTVKNIVELASSINIKVLTLYAFSTENWKRPKDEIFGLMTLLKAYLKSELESMMENNISFRVLGDTLRLPEEIQNEIANVCEKNKKQYRFNFKYCVKLRFTSGNT